MRHHSNTSCNNSCLVVCTRERITQIGSHGGRDSKEENSLPVHTRRKRTREAAINENVCYACTHEVLIDFNRHREKAATVNHLKAIIVRLYSARLQVVKVETNDHTLLQGERLSFFHLLKMRKRPALRMIISALDKDADIQSTNKGILHTFCRVNSVPYQ